MSEQLGSDADHIYATMTGIFMSNTDENYNFLEKIATMRARSRAARFLRVGYDEVDVAVATAKAHIDSVNALQDIRAEIKEMRGE